MIYTSDRVYMHLGQSLHDLGSRISAYKEQYAAEKIIDYQSCHCDW